MISGVGIDMIEVERVAAKISKENGFRELVYTDREIAYCETKANKFEHYAARFAAKEAFFKALGTGWVNGTSYNEIEILNQENGKPELHLIGETAKNLADRELGSFSVSMSHLKSIASAIVIIEK